MTIVVGVAAPDGLILAGDSRTSLSDGAGHHRIGSDFAAKVFEVCGYGIATYGEALVDEKTIAGQIDEFIAQLGAGEPSDLDDLAGRLGNYFQPRLIQWYQAKGVPWDAAQGFKLGFLVAGYDTSGVGGLREVRVPADPGPLILTLPQSTTNPGFYPQGQIDVIGRLIAGFDRQRMAIANVPVALPVQNALAGLEYVMLHPLALQDAVDLAHFLIRTTIDMQRFSDGTQALPNMPAGCGGPITMLAIRRRKTEWVDQHPLSKASRPGWAEGSY
jgi:hypothetical protein